MKNKINKITWTQHNLKMEIKGIQNAIRALEQKIGIKNQDG